MYFAYLFLVKDQGETKEGKIVRAKWRDKNQETTKEPQNRKCTFVKIAILFPSLIPSLILPTDDRETTERAPHQLPAHKKCCFLRLSPKKVDLIPKES